MTGIQGIPFDRIPEEWNAGWFREFIRDVLVNVDVRNAEGVGISITGEPSTVATLTSDSKGDAFIVVSASPNLDNERVLDVEPNVLTITDNGAGDTIVIGVALDGISFAKIQNIATSTLLGRVTAASGDIEQLTGTQATTLLDAFAGDSGAGGTKGLVPAPAAGDTAADKFLFADGTWAAVQNAAAGVRGLVLEATNVVDAVASTVSVTSADASDLATVITLANELKADLNTLVTDLNAVVTQFNAKLAADEAAGQQAT